MYKLYCYECGKETEDWYMVHDHVWQEAGLDRWKRGVFCCLACLSYLLGRSLRPSDFTAAQVNDEIRRQFITSHADDENC